MKPYFNKQRIFDQVVRALRKQGKPSVHGPTPMYRNPDGSRCAIGHIIDDAHYFAEIEGNTVKSKAVRRIISNQFQNGVNSDQFIFLERLQHIHDQIWEKHGEPFQNIEWCFRDVAVCYNLNQKVFRE